MTRTKEELVRLGYVTVSASLNLLGRVFEELREYERDGIDEHTKLAIASEVCKDVDLDQVKAMLEISECVKELKERNAPKSLHSR